MEYDPDVDAAYLTLRVGKIAESDEVRPGLILDHDDHKQLVGVEMLHFSRRFRPKTRKATTKADALAGIG